jgi:hypothetical protein
LQPAAVELVVWIDSTIVENIRQIRPFYAKQTQFSWTLKLMKSFYLHRVIKIKQDLGFVKTKPIKANFGLKIRVSKPNKPNSKPIQSQKQVQDPHAIRNTQYSIRFTIMYS